MNYRVIWDPKAFHRLLQDWNAANEPDEGIRAFDQIEETLSRDASVQGESRDRERRVLIVSPIGVLFHVSDERNEVLIVDAWMIQKRKP